MFSSPSLQIVAGIAGLLLGSLIAYATPRLVAYRLEEPPEPPSPTLLVPLIGGWWAKWLPGWTLALEVTTGAVFVALAFRYGGTLKLVLACGYSGLLMAIAYVDLRHRLVLNRLSYPGVVAVLALSILWKGVGPGSALLGAGVALGAFLILQIIGRGALGTGDTKLALLIGAMKGYPGVADALLLGVLIGALAGVFLLVVLRRGRKSYFAYAPYLAAGAILSFFIVPR